LKELAQMRVDAARFLSFDEHRHPDIFGKSWTPYKLGGKSATLAVALFNTKSADA
jgi:hypothetical protein